MNNLFLDLKSTDTFDTALERLEEYGVGSVMFTVKGNDKPILFLCLTQDSDLAALLILDEAWLMLGHPIFRERLKPTITNRKMPENGG